MKIFIISIVVLIGIGGFIGSSFVEDSGDSFALKLTGIIAIVGAIIGYFYSNYKEREEERLKQIEDDYFNALKGNDKAEALKLGRIYYGSLRDDGEITIYDEQAINNDLNSMTNTVNVVHENKNSTFTEKPLYCSKCGRPYVPNSDKKFCEECGNRY